MINQPMMSLAAPVDVLKMVGILPKISKTKITMTTYYVSLQAVCSMAGKSEQGTI
jgi:hypothetical protein